MSCNKKQTTTKITFKEIETCKFNDNYSGVDTSFLLIQNNFIKHLNPDNPQNIRVSSKIEESFYNYLINPIDKKKYRLTITDTSAYEIKHLDETKEILGYNCKKLIYKTKDQTITAFYTNEIDKTWSLISNYDIDGFVLEYTIDTRHNTTQYSAIELDLNTDHKIEIIDQDFIPISEEAYYEHFQKLEESLKTDEIKVGDKVLARTFTNLNNHEIQIPSPEEKVQVINFWFIGCRGCVHEFPELNQIREHFSNNEDVEFYGLTGDAKSNLIKFLKKKPFEFEVIPESYYYGVELGIVMYPTTLIINKEGKVAHIYSMIDKDNIEKVIADINNSLL
jgi:GLPGLI family protein